MRRCTESKFEILCDECNNQFEENKEFEANSNLVKREAPNQFGHMLPYYKMNNLLKTTDFNRTILIEKKSSRVNEWYNERKSVNRCWRVWF